MYNLFREMHRLRTCLGFLLCVSVVCLSTYAQEPAGAPELKITILEGDEALNNIRQRTAREPIVQVEDENHKPVAGAVVVFLLPNDGPGGAFAGGSKSLSVVTDANGRAIAHGLRPNNVAGQYQIRVNATFQGRTGRAVLQQTNVKAATGVATAGLSIKLITILAVAGAAGLGVGLFFAERGNGSSPVSITPGTATVGAP